MSALECVRETLAVALDELEEKLTQGQRPEFWEQLWERYVESKLDYKSAEETLPSKRRQVGADCRGGPFGGAEVLRRAKTEFGMGA